MILATAAHRPALILENTTYTFADLHTLMNQQIELFKEQTPKYLQLTATKDIKFIIQFLAGLTSRIPIGLFSPEVAPEARIRQEQLVEQPLHPKTALILFTSGSSGQPKAVQLSLANIEANVNAVIASLDFHSVSEQFLFLPLSYSFGILGQLLPALKSGVKTKLGTSLIDLKTAFENNDVSGMLSGVPSHWETILRLKQTDSSYVKNITHIVSAGAFLTPDLRRRIHAQFPDAKIFNNYGQTEASPRVLSMNSTDPRFFSNSTGFPVSGIEAKLSTEQELLIRGPQIMLGYAGDPTGTQDKVKEGWLHTGDIAQMESDGLIEILGRKDDLIKIGGERVSIHEIESALRGLDGCEDAAVYVEEDKLYEKKISALLVFPKIPPSRREIQKYLRTYLDSTKMPKDFYRIDKVPRNGNGKLARADLRSCLEIARSDKTRKII